MREIKGSARSAPSCTMGLPYYSRLGYRRNPIKAHFWVEALILIEKKNHTTSSIVRGGVNDQIKRKDWGMLEEPRMTAQIEEAL